MKPTYYPNHRPPSVDTPDDPDEFIFLRPLRDFGWSHDRHYYRLALSWASARARYWQKAKNVVWIKPILPIPHRERP